jgi:homocysteine S-methyltransferase
MFLDGFDLPHFAAFPLLDTVEGRAALRRYYDAYGEAARRSGLLPPGMCTEPC